MTRIRRALTGRDLVSFALAVWVISFGLAGLQARAGGPRWGLEIGVSDDGRAIAAAVDLTSAAWIAGIRPEDEILSVGVSDARQLVGSQVPSSAGSIQFRDATGASHTALAPKVPGSTLVLLLAGAAMFVVLGGLVFRWTNDILLGALFLVVAGSFATALVTTPPAMLGCFWAGIVTPAAALLAAPSLLGLFLLFPKPPRRGHTMAAAGLIVGALLALLSVIENLWGNSWPHFAVAVAETAFSAWMLVTLPTVLAVLAWRVSQRDQRRALTPLLVAAVVGVVPTIAMIAIPRLFGQGGSIAPEIAAVPLMAIPIAFAYSILRHQIFKLDAVLRTFLGRSVPVALGVAMVLPTWTALSMLGVPAAYAVLVSALGSALVTPPLARWLVARLDTWMYRSIRTVRTRSDDFRGERLEDLGASVCVWLRQALPIEWAAVLIHDSTVAASSRSRRILACDGDVPGWLNTSTEASARADAVTTTPVAQLESCDVLLVAGPRLDGEHLDGIQFEAMRILARQVRPTFEAAVLRERAQDEDRFREGLMSLAGELAAAGTIADVLRSFVRSAERLLVADTASLWRGGVDGAPVALDGHTWTSRPPDAVLRELADARESRQREREWSAVAARGAVLAFALDDGADDPLVCVLQRSGDALGFGLRDQSRARELTEHTVGALRRAAERAVLEEQLRHRAFYDTLTGVANRALFLDRLSHAVSRSAAHGFELAVLLIGLDRFKVVNDTFGHASGDDLLADVSQRLQNCLRESDTLARLSGDVFTVLVEGASAVERSANIAEAILDGLRAPFTIDGTDTFVSASIGFAGGTAIRESGRDLLREADSALYRAKAMGRGQYVAFEPAMDGLPTEHMHLESDLHRAIQRGELRVHYQPIFHLADGIISGFEALVRWEHPTKGLVAPGHFIPLAEETGLIVPIGKWVLREAAQRMREWQTQFVQARNMSVSVNLSARQLQDPALLGDIQDVIRDTGIHPSRLQLEITESIVMQEPEETIQKLNAVKALGVKLAVDDFGTGYSSLAYLKRFPVDVLKVDRAFVAGLVHGERDAAIVHTVVSLAQALGLRTTAEGIEDYDQWARLQELGCDQGQGFVFSRPLPADGVTDLLARRPQATPLRDAA